MKHKERLDVLLVTRNLAESRSKAQAMIMAGEVYVNGQKADKSGMEVDITANIEVRGSACPYVSRGGLKLEKAMTHFDIELNDKVCMDIGASTGGFTDCMLQNGAVKVYAVDVGYGQFAWKLRQDERNHKENQTNNVVVIHSCNNLGNTATNKITSTSCRKSASHGKSTYN